MVSREKEAELKRILEKIFQERCGLPAEVEFAYVPAKESRLRIQARKAEEEAAALAAAGISSAGEGMGSMEPGAGTLDTKEKSPMSIEIGIKGRAEDVVREENTAQSVGSGTLPVFATPAMTALMEKAAWTSLAPYLGEGESTVGTKLEITHDSASPLGIKVWAESEVTQVDGKRIVLKVAAYDEKGLIGQGVHERFIITNDRFLAKAGRKLEG